MSLARVWSKCLSLVFGMLRNTVRLYIAFYIVIYKEVIYITDICIAVIYIEVICVAVIFIADICIVVICMRVVYIEVDYIDLLI